MKLRSFRKLQNLHEYLYGAYPGKDIFVGLVNNSKTLWGSERLVYRESYILTINQGVPATNLFGYQLQPLEQVRIGAVLFAKVHHHFPISSSAVRLEEFCIPIYRYKKLLALMNVL